MRIYPGVWGCDGCGEVRWGRSLVERWVGGKVEMSGWEAIHMKQLSDTYETMERYIQSSGKVEMSGWEMRLQPLDADPESAGRHSSTGHTPLHATPGHAGRCGGVGHAEGRAPRSPDASGCGRSFVRGAPQQVATVAAELELKGVVRRRVRVE